MDKPETRMLSRRKFLESSAIAGAGLVASSLSPTPTRAAAPAARPAFNWRKYAGTEITCLFVNNPQGATMCGTMGDFEKLTGIKVDCQILEHAATRDKQGIEFAAGVSNIDFWHSLPANEAVKYFRAGWYEYLEPWVNNPELTSPDFNRQDFLSAASAIGTMQGKMIGIPMWSEVWPLYYNKEILEKGGVAVPKTMDELEAAAKKLHQPGREIYGWLARANSYFNTACMAAPFFSFGGKWLDQNGKANLTSPEAVKSLEWYSRMFRNYGPPAPETTDYVRATDLFKVGKAAFFYDSPSWVGVFADPKASSIVGKFDVTSWPAGPAGSVPSVLGWVACIGKFSKKKEAAYYLLQWLTSKEIGLKISTSTGVHPARKSVLESPEFKNWAAKVVPGTLAVLDYGLKNGRTDPFPPAENQTEARQIWGDAIVAAIQGKDPRAAAQEANTKFQALLDREKA